MILARALETAVAETEDTEGKEGVAGDGGLVVVDDFVHGTAELPVVLHVGRPEAFAVLLP